MDTERIIREWLAGNRPEGLTAEQHRAIGLISAGIATEQQMAAAGAEFVAAIKSSEDLFQRSCAANGPIEKAEMPEGVITWILSQESIDRDGDIIRQKGWKLANYKKNPVVIPYHLHRSDPVAVGEKLRVEVIAGVDALVADLRFAVEESEDAARKYRLAKGGFIRAGSVGFMPIKTTVPSSDEERSKLGVGRFGVVYEKAELLEFSIVTVPSHPNALQRGVKDGAILEADADWAAAEADPTEKEWERMMRERARSFVDMGAHSEEEKKAHAPHKTPLAPEDAPWSASAELKKAEGAEQLWRMHAWRDDESDADAKSSYKLPHHRASGETVWKGVAAAMAALLGARGGVDIPDADRRGVYNHLKAHYKQFDKEPPDFKDAEMPPAPVPDYEQGESTPDPHWSGVSAALASLAEGQQRQADALEMLARSLTDLGTCLGGTRNAKAEPAPKADDSETAILESIAALRSQILSTLDRS